VERLFIDTGGWVALNNKKNKHHKDAVEANRDFLDSDFFYVTSEYILNETYTLLRFDVGHMKSKICRRRGKYRYCL